MLVSVFAIMLVTVVVVVFAVVESDHAYDGECGYDFVGTMVGCGMVEW
jgi:hypothetical protein